MKYLKTFELNNYYNEHYWKISIKKYYYEASIKKIGMVGDAYEYWTNEVPKQFKDVKEDKIYIFRTFTNDGTFYWCWEKLDYGFLEKSKYMGEIKITKKELEDEIIRQESQKYNI